MRTLLRPVAVALAACVASVAVATLSADVQKRLADAKYVYVQSERKTGAWSKPAEIWFLEHDGAVWVGTRPASWRVRRIKAGRTKARIAVGSPDGPTFEATGAVVKDAAAEARLLEVFARKYPERWAQHESSFRDGFKSGERVLVRYTPR